MSERRCDVHPNTEYCDGGTGCSYREPQEGASRNAVPSNAGGHTCPGDVPSCGSDELAAARAAFAPFATTSSMDLRVAGRALLRMVDELRAENVEWMVAVKGKGGWNDMVLELRDDVRLYKSMFEAADASNGELRADRDAYVVELEQTRAKLAEAEYWRLIHKNTVDKLEAKLAEAEKMRAGAVAIQGALEKRAEAAEARTLKLAEALFAATNGHVDIDKLEGKP